MKRRELIKGCAGGVFAGLLPASQGRADATPDVVLEITARHDAVRLLKGESTAVLRYTGRVIQGRASALRASNSYLGPTIDLHQGENVRILFRNRLDEPSIIHWHGFIVSELADGHPRFAVSTGSDYTYNFTVKNPAGTYLYHPHPHGRTGFQVYAGLAGLLIVRDPMEMALELPSSEHELPLVIQDRRIDNDNQLVFSDSMMDQMSGLLGDTVLVNGAADALFNVSPRAYRLRIVNASNARIYKLAWSDEQPLTVIGTDNGLLSAAGGAKRRPYVMLGPTERVELLEDFATRRPGSEVQLFSRAFDDGTRMVGGDSMMGGMMGGGSMMQGMMGDGGMMGMMRSTQGQEMPIAQFSVNREQPGPEHVLRLPEWEPALREPQQSLVTSLGFRHMQGFLNGRTFEMTGVARDERVTRAAPILWTFEHDEKAMGMHMAHPMHIHGVRFRVVERIRRHGAGTDVIDGLVDTGYKDTVLVFPGERVRVQLEASEPGLFLYHCHNLEHEDGGMMRNFLVQT